MYKTYTGIAKL